MGAEGDANSKTQVSEEPKPLGCATYLELSRLRNPEGLIKVGDECTNEMPLVGARTAFGWGGMVNAGVCMHWIAKC